jgi:hypothetical protein
MKIRFACILLLPSRANFQRAMKLESQSQVILKEIVYKGKLFFMVISSREPRD